MIKSNLYLKISLLILVSLGFFFFFYYSKSDLEKCTDNKLRELNRANEPFLEQSLKIKIKSEFYEGYFRSCELEKRQIPETFKNKYK